MKMRSRRFQPLIAIVCMLCAFAVGGAVWGLIIPQDHATVQGAYLELDPLTEGVQFQGFMYLVIGLAVIAVASGWGLWAALPSFRGPMMIILLAISAYFGGTVFAAVGNWLAGALHPMPSESSVHTGQELFWAPYVRPGIALAVAPFVASLVYWCAAVVGKGEFPDEAPQEAHVNPGSDPALG